MAVELNRSLAFAPHGFPEILSQSVQKFPNRRRLEYCPEHLPSRVPLDREQRQWIKARATDKHGILRSEWTGMKIEFPSIHHIRPVAYLVAQFDPLGEIGPDLYDTPDNIIVLSEAEHMRLHPEARRLNLLWIRDRRQFYREVRQIQVRLMNGEKNWIDKYDERFLAIAEERTLAFIKKEHPWPLHKSRKFRKAA